MPSKKADSKRLTRKIKMVRNPWEPRTIVEVLTFACTSTAVSTIAVQAIKRWFDNRKIRLIVKSGDNELTIEGSMSNRLIKKRIEFFNELIGDSSTERIKVIPPKGVDRKLKKDDWQRNKKKR